MMTIVDAYDGDHARLVTEDGAPLVVPATVVAAAGLRHLRTGQRLIVSLDETGAVATLHLP